jgi:hypothetical protein
LKRFSYQQPAFQSQGLMISMPQSVKSLTLRVASLAPRDRAIAAIMASNRLIGLPAALREAAISA